MDVGGDGEERGGVLVLPFLVIMQAEGDRQTRLNLSSCWVDVDGIEPAKKVCTFSQRMHSS